ncbi:hypothetical protein X744_16955 [Mesorhizobium sp. LNJC372A00]|nr:hypothetical protein X744_16955 [Mesorhizobium sp. LNJC372A00]
MGKGWTFQSLIDQKMTSRRTATPQRAIISRELELVKLRDRFSLEAPAQAEMRQVRQQQSRADLLAGHQPERLWQGEGQLTSQRNSNANTKADSEGQGTACWQERGRRRNRAPHVQAGLSRALAISSKKLSSGQCRSKPTSNL